MIMRLALKVFVKVLYLVKYYAAHITAASHSGSIHLVENEAKEGVILFIALMATIFTTYVFTCTYFYRMELSKNVLL